MSNAHIVYKRNQEKARNIKQVQNLKYLINKNNKIGYDPIYNLHILYRELTCIKSIETVPNLCVISTDDLILEAVNNMMTVYDGHILYSYDTTFELGDFFLSPLLVRHPLFKNDPAFPVAFFFHDVKLEKVHTKFFNWIKEVRIFQIL